MDLHQSCKIMFLVLAGFAVFSCYCRSDYNLPLFVFAFYLWDSPRDAIAQRIRLTYLFVFTFIIDFVWLVYWGPFWNSETFENSYKKGIQTFVLVMSSIAFVVKFATIIMVLVANNEVKSSFTPSGAKNQVLSAYKGGKPNA